MKYISIIAIAFAAMQTNPVFAQTAATQPSVNQSNLPATGITRLSINANEAEKSARAQCIASGKKIVDDKCTTPDAQGRFSCTKKCS